MFNSLNIKPKNGSQILIRFKDGVLNYGVPCYIVEYFFKEGSEDLLYEASGEGYMKINSNHVKDWCYVEDIMILK